MALVVLAVVLTVVVDRRWGLSAAALWAVFCASTASITVVRWSVAVGLGCLALTPLFTIADHNA